MVNALRDYVICHVAILSRSQQDTEDDLGLPKQYNIRNRLVEGGLERSSLLGALSCILNSILNEYHKCIFV